MQNNYFNTNQYPCMYPAQNPNAVSINIISPQAFASPSGATCPIQNPNFYSLYGQNAMPNYGYPQNYNNIGSTQGMVPANYAANAYPNALNENNSKDLNNKSNLSSETNLVQKTDVENNKETSEAKKTDVENNKETSEAKKTDKTKKVTPLTDEYIKSLENYLNNENPKIRLIGAKEVMERFKEDENRKDNPSLMALLNKSLRDTSPAVRFLGLTTLQLGYAVGNDETVTILKEIQSQNTDKIGEDSLLASEILLTMAGGQKVDAPMTQGEIEKEASKQTKKEGN